MAVLRIFTFVLAALALGCLPFAGDGTVVDGKFNLLVYFAYDEADATAWEDVFEEYSLLLSNATEGQLQLGTVAFTKCEQQKNQADVWVLNDFSGARSHLSGLGVPGRHMTISQTHKSTSGGAIGQFGLVHETGHYLWGVYDEYKGYVGNTPATDPLHFCATPSGTGGCFMDGGTTLFPNNLRTEFCTQASLGFTDTAHFEGVNNGMGQAVRTNQEFFLGRSCWERIESSGVGGLTHPVIAPTDAEPPHDDVVFDYSRLSGPLGLALVIDKSGSMSSEGKLELAIQSAQTAVGLMRDGEILTVVAFDDAPQTVFPPTVMNTNTKNAANAAIGSITAEGGTEIGDAVLRAVNLLGNVQGCKEFVVVLTDGVSDGIAVDDPSVVTALQNGDHNTFGVALGSFSDDAGLISVAGQTGGQFFKTNETTDLPLTFAQIFSAASGGVNVSEAGGDSVPPASVSERAFEVSDAAVRLHVSLGFRVGTELALELVAPDGTSIDFARPPAGVQVFASDVQKRMLVDAPEPGVWLARVTEVAGTEANFDFLAYVDTFDLSITTRAASDQVSYPEPMILSVQVVAGVPVGGALVEATVERPDGTTIETRFFDDGRRASGDEKADDGVYSTRFLGYAGDGPYVFSVRVENIDGQAASNQECGIFGRPGRAPGGEAAGESEEGQIPGPIPPFTACTTHTILLEGGPGVATPGTATLGVHPNLTGATDLEVATSAPTPLAGFTLTADPAEALVWRRLAFRIDATGLTGDLEALALTFDSDGDGLPDGTGFPLAQARVEQGHVVFDDPSGSLDAIPPGTTAHYLLTAGEALFPQDPQPDGETEGSSGTVVGIPPGPDSPILARWPAAILLFALAWICARRRRGRLALAGCAAACAALACTSGSGASAASYRLRVTPVDIELSGASTEADVQVEGETLAFRFRLR